MKVKRTGAADYGRWTKALICGAPGAGKTLISSTWPNPFYASAEGGTMSIADRNIPYVEISTSQELLNLKNSMDQDADVREKLFGFRIDTIVVDTIDEIQRILIRERLTENRKDALQLQDWGWLGEQMRAIVTGFRNLDMHVVFTCHTKETSDEETGRMYFKPNLQGSFSSDLPGYVDLALLLRAVPKTETKDDKTERVIVRTLQTFPDTQHTWIKDRSGKLPQEFRVNFNDDFERMNEAIFGSLSLVDNKVMDIDENAEVEPDPPAPVRTLGKTPKAKEEATTHPGGPSKTSLNGDSTFVCELCGDKEVTETQRDLSKIRFRSILCRPCFNTEREKVSATKE